MLYSSLSTAGRFGKTPDDLKNAAKSGQDAIAKTSADPKLEVIDYVSQAKRSRVPIDGETLRHCRHLGPALI